MTWLVLDPAGELYAHGKTPGEAIEAAVRRYRPEVASGAKRAVWQFMAMHAYTIDDVLDWPIRSEQLT